jgi:rhodanese-related sulfurtransferase
MNRQVTSVQDVFRLQQANVPLDLIDVRTPAEYAEVHADGARSIPLDGLDPRAVMAVRREPAADPLYVICKSGARAAKAVERFRAAGYGNVRSVDGGTDAWARAGLPVVRGPRAPMSIERQVRIVTGTLVTLGVLLGWHVHPAFYLLAGFIGVGLVVTAMVNWCGTALLLAKMPWNRRDGCVGGARACPASAAQASHDPRG